jgi:hypothetical protein
MPFGAWKGQKTLFFLFWLPFFSKNLNHTAKDVSIFHPKLGGNRRPNYFPTSIPSRHTSHQHGRPIANGRFLTWRTMANLLQAINFWHAKFLTSCKFSLFLFRIPLYIFQIYNVVMNKVLQGSNNQQPSNIGRNTKLLFKMMWTSYPILNNHYLQGVPRSSIPIPFFFNVSFCYFGTFFCYMV